MHLAPEDAELRILNDKWARMRAEGSIPDCLTLYGHRDWVAPFAVASLGTGEEKMLNKSHDDLAKAEDCNDQTFVEVLRYITFFFDKTYLSRETERHSGPRSSNLVKSAKAFLEKDVVDLVRSFGTSGWRKAVDEYYLSAFVDGGLQYFGIRTLTDGVVTDDLADGNLWETAAATNRLRFTEPTTRYGAFSVDAIEGEEPVILYGQNAAHLRFHATLRTDPHHTPSNVFYDLRLVGPEAWRIVRSIQPSIEDTELAYNSVIGSRYFSSSASGALPFLYRWWALCDLGDRLDSDETLSKALRHHLILASDCRIVWCHEAENGFLHRTGGKDSLVIVDAAGTKTVQDLRVVATHALDAIVNSMRFGGDELPSALKTRFVAVNRKKEKGLVRHKNGMYIFTLAGGIH